MDAARGWKTGPRTAPDLPPAGLIFMALADRATRRLHDMFSRWARERETDLTTANDAANAPQDPRTAMRSIKQMLHRCRDHYQRRYATLPWAELEAEAIRQGCSPADVFFDRAGRRVPDLPPHLSALVADGRAATDTKAQPHQGGVMTDRRQDPARPEQPGKGGFDEGQRARPDAGRVGQFSDGNEQLPDTERIGQFSDGNEQLPDTERQGKFSDSVDPDR